MLDNRERTLSLYFPKDKAHLVDAVRKLAASQDRSTNYVLIQSIERLVASSKKGKTKMVLGNS